MIGVFDGIGVFSGAGVFDGTGVLSGGVLGGGAVTPVPPEGFIAVLQPDGTITRQPNGQINYAPLP